MNISEVCREGAITKGEVGIEIEVEGYNIPMSAPLGWTKEMDPSLRGESAEFILTKPISRNSIKKFLSRIEDAYEESGTEVYQSNRQSVHVHINVQEMSTVEVYNYAVLFLILETELVKFCGSKRQGNLFCLRSSDAEGIIQQLEESVKNFYRLDTDQIRYSAMNLSSLFKFGSLEFRSMRGTTDFSLIEQWVDMLISIKDAALTFKSPAEIMNSFSKMGVESFVERVLGKNAHVVLDQKSYYSNLYNSLRNLQVLSYKTNWAKLDVKEEVAGIPRGVVGRGVNAIDNFVGMRLAQRPVVDWGDEDEDEEEYDEDDDDMY